MERFKNSKSYLIKIMNDKIPVAAILSQGGDFDEALEETTKKLQNEAAFYCGLLSGQLDKHRNYSAIAILLKRVDALNNKLAEVYLVKAANIYDEHINKLHIQKTQEEYEQECDLASMLVQYATELKPSIRLKKEYIMEFMNQYKPYKRLQHIGTYLRIGFPKSIVEFVNNTIESAIMFNEIDKSLGAREKEIIEKYFDKKT